MVVTMLPNEAIKTNKERFESSINRRKVLKTTGLALTSSVFTVGSVVAHSGDPAGSGDSVAIGEGSASSYTERARGKLSAVGVQFDAAVLNGLPRTAESYQLNLPDGDTRRFEYIGMDYNPEGHEPPALYGHPHFDFHFYMLDEETVAAIPGGAPEYDIPNALMPSNTVTSDDYSENPAPRTVVPGMGEHLVSIPESMPSNPGDDGWSVYIWGAYDPDGDGTGQLTFMEPMITDAYLRDVKEDGNPDNEVISSIPMPERFMKGGWYPTEYVVRYHGHDDTFTVSLESFEQFSGYGRR